MSTFSFSQSSYPKKILIDGDTLVCITPTQLRQINGLLVDRMEYKQVNDSLFLTIGRYRELVSVLEQQTQTLTLINANLTAQISKSDTLVGLVTKERDSLQKKAEKQGRLIRYGGMGVGVLLIILAIF